MWMHPGIALSLSDKSELRFQTPGLFTYCTPQAGWLSFCSDNTPAVTKSGYFLSNIRSNYLEAGEE